jgi:phage gp45-like
MWRRCKMSLEKTEKGLVYKLSQKCLNQEEEIQNLIKNITVMQEVIEKQQIKINKKQVRINTLKAQLKNSKENFEGLDQGTIESFNDIYNNINTIFEKLDSDQELQKDFIINAAKINLKEMFRHQ